MKTSTSFLKLLMLSLKCGEEFKNASFTTRAKASLLLVRYEKLNCIDYCKNESYPNLKWNKESKKWEIEQGFTKDQLPWNSRQILKETSKLPSLFFKSWVLTLNKTWMIHNLLVNPDDHSNVFYSNICPENITFYMKSKYILHFPWFLIYPKKLMSTNTH